MRRIFGEVFFFFFFFFFSKNKQEAANVDIMMDDTGAEPVAECQWVELQFVMFKWEVVRKAARSTY